MTITDYKFLNKLKYEEINCSSIPKSVRNANYFKNLLDTDIIKLIGSWQKGKIKLNVSEKIYFDTFFDSNFPSDIIQEFDRVNNIKTLRNSKARNTESNKIALFRGKQVIKINGLEVDLNFYTQKYQLFSAVLESLVSNKVCFVENLYSFLNVEKVIKEDYVFIHTYGRIGEGILKNIKTNLVLVFSDYDFVGLDEYLKIKEKFINTTFFVPENYKFLFQTYSRPLKDSKKETTQKPSKRLQRTSDKVALEILNEIYKTQHFLEQEILINP